MSLLLKFPSLCDLSFYLALPYFRFINAFETPSEVILVMEYLDGGELFERVAADDFNLTESDCCLFMRQICRGVQYLHNHNIVHLDLKVNVPGL